VAGTNHELLVTGPPSGSLPLTRPAEDARVRLASRAGCAGSLAALGL